MECVPCGDPPPPYEPHCKSWFCFSVFSFNFKAWQKKLESQLQTLFKTHFLVSK